MLTRHRRITAVVNFDLPEDLEQRIFHRLKKIKASAATHPIKLDSQLIEDIYLLVNHQLRFMVQKIPGLNWQSLNPNADVTARFTSVLNKAFERILEKYQDKLARAENARELRGYVSSVMSSIMLNHYGRKTRFAAILNKLGLTEEEERKRQEALGTLIAERASHFESRTGIQYKKFLDRLQTWAKSDDLGLQQLEMVLRLRYVDGMSHEDVASQMEIPKSMVKSLLEKARERLSDLRP